MSAPKAPPSLTPNLPPLFFETLEQRLLLSATPFTFTANPLISQSLTLSIVDVLGSPTVRLTDTGSGAILQQQAVIDTSTISITLSNQNDRITLASDFSAIGGGINGLLGTDRIFGASKGSYLITGQDTGVALGLSFAAVEGLTGSAGINELFQLSTTGAMSAGIDGAGGTDTVRLTGADTSVNLQVNSSTTATLSVNGAVARTTVLSNVEVIADQTAPVTRVVTGSALAEGVTLSQSGSTVTARFNSVLAYTFTQTTGTVTIDEGLGIGSITVASNLTMSNSTVTFRAESISVGGFTIDTVGGLADGSLSLIATGTTVAVGGSIDGLSATIQTGNAQITLAGSALRSGSITLSATTTVTATATASTLALAGANATATVSITGAKLVATSGAISVTAVTNITTQATATAVNGTTNAGIDAAISMALAQNTTTVNLADSTVTALGNVTVRSRNNLAMTTTATGASGVGAVVAASFVSGATSVTLSGNGDISSNGAIDVSAQEGATVTTTATGGTGGAVANAGASQGEQVLADSNARTNEGAFPVAAAVALAKLDRTTTVTLSGVQSLNGATGNRIASQSSDTVNTLADAGATTGNIAAAAAINLLTTQDTVNLLGQTTAGGSGLSVQVGEFSRLGSRSAVTALSGASSTKDLGLAGALALNSVNVDRTITLGPTSGLSVSGGDLSMTASGASNDIADARSGANKGATVGIGASVALNLVDRDTLVEVQAGAGLSVSGGGAVLLSQTSGVATTTAVAGAAGGTALTPAFAMTEANSDNQVVVGAGTGLSVTTGLTLNVSHGETITTEARGTSQGTSVSVGGAVALTLGLQDATVLLQRNVAATSAAISAEQRLDSTTRAIAATTGGRTPGSGAMTADSQAASAAGFASTESGETVSAPSTATQQGGIGVAAALALSVQKGGTQAVIDAGAAVLAASGGVTLTAQTDLDASVLADGSVVTSAFGAAAAVALNTADLTTLAELRGAVTGNLTIEAGIGNATDTSSPDISTLVTKAIAGAGATSFGLAGSFALTSDNLDARASVKGGASAGGGALTLRAINRTSAETTASADATLGTGGSGVGIGLGVAIGILDADAEAVVAGDAAITASSLTMLAQTGHVAVTKAAAGSANGSVSAVPSFALTVSHNDASVSLPAGVGLTLFGGVDLRSNSALDATTEAKSAAAASSVGAGVSVALTSAEDQAVTEVARSLDAGGTIAIDAVQKGNVVTRAFASAAGVKNEGAGGPQTADDQASDAADYATTRGATTGGAGSAASANGQFGLSAALALGFLKGGARSHVAAGAVLHAVEDASVTAEGDVDGTTLADASQVLAPGLAVKSVGIGAAVAISMLDRAIIAVVDGSVTGDGSVNVASGMIADPKAAPRNTVRTTAVSGVGAGDVAVTGAFALTSGGVDALAEIGTTGAASGGKLLTISADSANDLDATATADATFGASGGSGVGIGAGVALVLSGSEATAHVAGGMGGAGALKIHAQVDTLVTGRAAAGAANGAVSIAPSVFVAVDTTAARALMDAGSDALFGDAAAVEAINIHSVTATAASAATAATAALGVTVALAVDNGVSEATLSRKLLAKGDANLTASLRSDVAIIAIASAKGVSQGTSGVAGSTSDAQMAQQAGFAGGLGGASGALPGAQSSGGAFGLAASLALSVVGGGATARVTTTGVLQSENGAVTVAALNDADSSVTADSSVVKGNAASGPTVGVGAAVALNVATRVTRALIEGTVNAAKSVLVQAGTATDTDALKRSILIAKAVAGVGATTAAVSGAFAMNANSLTANASPAATAKLATVDGPVGFFAENRSGAAATASANAALGQGGSGVGVGVGVGLNLMTGQTLADLPGTVTISGAGLVVAAATDYLSGGAAAAGATDGTVGIAPSVMLNIDQTNTSASLAAGTALTLTGAVRITASSLNVATGTARSAGTGATAGLGVSFVLSIANGKTTAVVNRGVTTTGDITVSASQRNDVSMTAVASGSGVSTSTSGVATQQADSQIAKELSFADAMGGSGGVSAPSAESSSGKFGLAAAIGLSIVTGTVEARLDASGRLTSTAGGVTVAALQDVDSTINADASTIVAGSKAQPDIGVGAAVAINTINRTALARVNGNISGALGVTINAGMALDPLAVNRSVMVAKAISGVGAKNVGVSGSFAMNQVNLDATPVIVAGRTIAAGGAGTKLLATVNTQATATASAAANLGVAGSATTGVGVGGALALNLLDSDSLIAPPATANFTGAGLLLDARGEHIAAGLAQAGIRGGDVAVAPAVYIVAATNTAEARLAGGAALNLTGNLGLLASEKTTVSGTANSAATAAGTAAIGVTLSLAVMENSATARLARNVTTTGAATLGATRADHVTLLSTASAAGLTQAGSGGDTSADQQIGRELGFANTKGGTAGAVGSVVATDSAGSSKSVGIAAALALSVMSGDSVAEVVLGTRLAAGGLVTVSAEADSDSSATADAKTVNTSVGIGAAVGLNVVTQDNTALVAGTVVSNGLDIRATGLTGDSEPMNSFVARAVSGAGASSVGISGAFAANLETLTSTALLTGSAEQGLTGDVTITATMATSSSAFGSSKAINDATGTTSSSTSVGIGLSFGLNLLDNDVTAGLAAASVLTGGHDVTIAATGTHTSTTKAAAGSGGSVGISPSLALLVSGNAARAELGAGTALNITGSLSSEAQQSHVAVLDADASATGDRVAVGAAVALAVLPEIATASPLRNVTAVGDITLSSDLVTGVTSTTLASTNGVTKGATDPGTSDGQSANLISFANAAGGSAATAPNAAQVGGSGGSQSVGVAAALALNLVDGQALTVLGLGLSLQAGGSVSLLSRLDLDAEAQGDGSSAAGTVGVGVGVALNVVNGQNFARVIGSANAGGALTVSAIMSPFGNGVDALTAKANAGAAGSTVGVAGAFAMNISNIRTLAEVAGSASGGGVVTVEAAAKSNDIAEAISAVSDRASGGKGGQVGVGAAVAINILNDDETAQVLSGVPLTASGGLVITATGDHTGSALAKAGAAGSVAVAPAVALNIVTDETQAILADGNAVVSTGLVEVSAAHRGIYAATADAETSGKSAGVGAAVALNILVDAAAASIARNVATGATLTLKSQNQMSGFAQAKGSASGNSSGGSNADQQADQSVNNNSAITSRAGAMDVGDAQTGVDQGAAESSSAAGGREPGGVGVGAAIAFNTIVTSSRATVADGVTLAAVGDLTVQSMQEVDASANAQGTALKARGTNIGAAVALNVVTAENFAILGATAKLLGDGSVRVMALDLVTDKGAQTNDLTTQAVSGAGGDQAAVAASLAVNIANFNTRAVLGDGSVTVAKGGNMRVQAQSTFTTQNVAGGAAINIGSGASVGAAAVVNIFTATSLALVDGASADVGGIMVVSSSTSYVPRAFELVPSTGINLTSLAGGGAFGLGDASIGGSVAVDIINITTQAEIADSTRVNQGGFAALANQSVGLSARTTMTVNSVAGGFGAALGSAGVGAGVAVGVINDTTLARIGTGALVTAKGAIGLQSAATVSRTGAAASFGAAGTAGIGGAVLVDVFNSSTKSVIDANTAIDAGGLVSIVATDVDTLTEIAGSGAVGGNTGVGVGLLTVTHNDLTEALLGDAARVITHGGMLIRATSGEIVSGTAVAGAGGSTAGVAASPAVTVLNEATHGRIGRGVTVTGVGDTAAIPDILVAAVDTTKSTKVAGSVALGGSAGIGAGLDVTTLTKNTEANVGGGSNVTTTGSLDIRAGNREDLTSVVMTGAGSGSVAVNGSVGIVSANITTRAYIEGTETVLGRTVVDAGNNVIVQSADSSEYDLFAGGIGFAFSASIGASVSVPVVTKLTEAFIGRNADVTGRANGAAGNSLGGFSEAYRALIKGEVEVVSGDAGAGSLPIGQKNPGGPGGALQDTNGNTVSPAYDGNDDAAQVLQLTPSALSVRGVAVVALNSDDLGQFAMTGTGSGAVAVALSGDVTVFSVKTSARIDEGARINKAAGVEGASQDVVVLAGSDFVGLTVAGVAAIAGTAAVSPSVAVVVLNEQTEALIGAGVDVEAQDSVALKSFAHEKYTAVVAGVSVAGGGAVGGSVGVLQLTSTTRAHIGEVNEGGVDRSATVFSNRDVLVQALDDTEVVTFQGQVAVAATAAVGASVGVASLTKNTSAQIAAGSRVTALGNAAAGGEGLGLFPVDGRFDDGKSVSGLSLLAGANEKIEALAFTGAVGPSAAGIAGAVSIAVIDSDVLARIGTGARINQGALGGLGQDVRVMAENDVNGLGGSGGLGGGAVGIAGAFTIGVVRNAVEADIADGTTILAGGWVKVSSRSHQDITSFAASAGLGAGAGAISFAIWVIGGDYSAGGGSVSETDWAGTYQGHADGGMVSGGYSSVLGASKPFTFSGASVNATSNSIFIGTSGLRTGDAVIFRRNTATINGLVDGQTYYVIANPASPSTIKLASSAANAAAGIVIDLTASTGSRATLSMVDTAASDAAIADQRSALVSGRPTINLSSALDDDPASQGTFAHVGQSVTITAVDGLRILAADDLEFTQVSGNVAIGGVGVGASFATLIHNQPVTAFLGNGSTVAASGFGVDVLALSNEDITQIAVGAAVGSGGVTGSATINVLTETTNASIGEGVTVEITRVVGAKARPDLEIRANDSTDVSDVAGAASFGAAAGVGVGLDVVSLTKSTTATIGEQAQVSSDGSVILRALSAEDLGSLSVTGSGSGGVAMAGSASVLVLNTFTVATITGSKEAGLGSIVTAEGNVVLEAADDDEIDIFAGAFTVGLAAALGGGAGVPVVSRVVKAEIGDKTTVTGRGLQGTDVVRDGTYSDTFTAPGTGDVVSGDVGDGHTGYNTKQSPGGAPVDPDDDGRKTNYDDSYQGTAGAGQVHGYKADTLNGRGVLVSATSSDDISTLGVSGGISGTLAVNFSGVVSSVTSFTVARIGNATVNPDDGGGAGAGQDVLVMAGSDFTSLSVAAAISGGSVGGVAPSAAVSFIGLTTTAVIDAGAKVRAQDGVQVNAYANQVISFVGAGGAVAGVFAFGATSGVVSLKSATTALIGNGAVVLTSGTVRVGASDDTQITGIVGAVGGAGIAGLGASAQVIVIQKDTVALIDENAQVEALGHDDQSAVTSALNGVNAQDGGLAGIDLVRGIVVEAKSSELISLLSIAAGVGLAFGFGGAVSVVAVDSDTTAKIADNAIVAAGDATARANLRVVAGNDFKAFMHAGAGALGFAGLAGALNVGILRNGVLAEIGTGADVFAAGNIVVRGLSSRDIRGITVAAGVGAITAAGSISIWNLGGTFKSDYAYDETDVGGTGTSDQQLSNTSRSENALSGSHWDTEQDDLLRGHDTKTGEGWEDILNGRSMGSGGSSSRVDFILGQGHGAVRADGPDGSITGTLANSLGDIEGTTARVVNAASVTAGVDLDVRAEDVTLFDGVAGGIVAGFAGIGASITLLNNNMGVVATIIGSAGAGGSINVTAMSTATTGNFAMMGGLGAIVLGAQVAVTTDGSTRLAEVTGGTLSASTPSNVQAIRNADHTAQALGVTALSALSGGVSVGLVKLVGSTTANSTSTWSDVANPAGNLVTVAARTDTSIAVQSWGVALGLIAAANGAVAWGEDSSIVSASASGAQDMNGQIDVIAAAQSTIDAKGVAGTLSLGGALSAGVAVAKLKPTVTATASLTGTIGAARALAAMNSDPETGLDISGLGAHAEAWSFGAALIGVAAAGAIAVTDVTPTIAAANSSGSAATRQREARAYGTLTASSDTVGFAGGLVGFGAAVSFATVIGSVSASVSGSSSGGVVVDSLAHLNADANTQAVSGGLVAGSANFAYATVKTEVSSALTGTIRADQPGAIDVESRADGHATSSTRGTSVGLIAGTGPAALGGSIAISNYAPKITASSKATIAAATSVTIKATANGQASATTGGSGNASDDPGDITIGLLAFFGGFADATQAAKATAELGGTVTSSGIVTVSSLSTTEAQSSTSDLGIGLLTFGMSFSHASNSANSTTSILGSAVVNAAQIVLGSTGAHYAKASGAAAAVGVIGGVTAVDATTSMNTVALTDILAGARLTATGQVQVVTRNASEGDGEADATAGGLFGAGGGTVAVLNLTTSSQSNVGSAAQVSGASVTIQAFGGTQPLAVTSDYSFSQSAGDVTSDVIRVTNHGLITGQSVQLGTTTTNAWANPDRVYTVLNTTDPNTFRLGASFDASHVNATRDEIVFDGPHGFVTGDKVIYSRGSSTSIIAGAAPASLFVLVLNATTIKLLDYNPASGLRGTEFDGGDVNGTTNEITKAGHGFSEGQTVTYHGPHEVTFNAGAVDLNAAQDAILDSRNTIVLKNHQFQTGDIVKYTISAGGVRLGALTTSTDYFVIRVDDNTIRLATTQARALAGTAIDIDQTDSSSAARSTVHRLNPPPGAIGGLVEGRSYKVTLVSGQPDKFKLLDEVSGAVINLLTTAPGGSSALVREGIDLLARTGTQSVYIDMVGGISGVIQGPGGQSLTDAVLAQGDGRSRLVVDGFALAGVGITANVAATTVNSTVKVNIAPGTVAAPTLVQARSGNVLLQAENRFDVVVDGSAGSGGLVAAGSATTSATLTAVTEVNIGSAGGVGAGNTRVLASGDITANASQISNAAANAFSTGVAGISLASANARANSTHTTAVFVGIGALVQANTINLTATTSDQVSTVMGVNSDGVGASAAAGNFGTSGSTITGASENRVQVAAAASVLAANALTLLSVIDGSVVKSSAKAHSIAGGGDSSAVARATANDKNKIVLDGTSRLQGLASVTLRARVDSYDISTTADARLIAFGGASNSTAASTATVANSVEGKATSLVRTPSLLVDIAKLAAKPGLTLAALADRSGIGFVFGDANSNPSNTASHTITFNSNVDLLRRVGSDVVLVVNAAGVVTTANNVRVEGGNGVGFDADADGLIVVDNIGLDADGDATFNANAGALITGSGGIWTVFKGPANVTITNLSTAKLVLNTIDTAFGTLGTAAGDVDVNIQVDKAQAFKFDIVTKYDTSTATTSDDQKVTVTSVGSVAVAGVISNALGQVSITSSAGSIVKGAGAGRIITKGLVLNASRDIGENPIATVGQGKLVVVFVKAGSRAPTASIIAGRDIFMTGVAVQRDTTATRPTVTITTLQAGRDVDMSLTDTELQTVLPANHVGGIVVDAKDVAPNTVTPSGGGPISVAQFYREFYFPDASAGTASPDALGIFGTASKVDGNATWTFQNVSVTGKQSIVAAPLGAGTVVTINLPKAAAPVSGTATLAAAPMAKTTFVDLGGAAMAAGSLAVKSGLDEDWTSDAAKLAVIDWSGAAA